MAQDAGEDGAAAGRVAPLGDRGLRVCRGPERGGNVKIWTITELLSTKALVAEGRTMKHCVATYARSCATGTARSGRWRRDVRGTLEAADHRGAQRHEVDLSGARKVQRFGGREAPWRPAPMGRTGGPSVGKLYLRYVFETSRDGLCSKSAFQNESRRNEAKPPFRQRNASSPRPAPTDSPMTHPPLVRGQLHDGDGFNWIGRRFAGYCATGILLTALLSDATSMISSSPTSRSRRWSRVIFASMTTCSFFKRKSIRALPPA